MKILHPKVRELQLRAAPTNYSSLLSIDAKGELVEDNVIKCYLCVWNVPDDYGTVFVRGAFAKSIADRGPKSNAKQKILFLWQHDTRDPIGQFRVLEEDEYGLYAEVVLDDFEAVQNSKRCASQVRSGTINQYSFGFYYIWDRVEYNETLDAVMVYEAELQEGSAVTFGSQAETYTVRSKEDYERDKLLLDDDTEEFIKTVPRSKQLELRQLITRHISLTVSMPSELRQKTLDSVKPDEKRDQLNISEILKAFQ